MPMPFENMVHSVISVLHPVLQCHNNSPGWKDSHSQGQDTKMYIWWNKVAFPQISAPDSFTLEQRLPLAKASLDNTWKVPLWVPGPQARCYSYPAGGLSMGFLLQGYSGNPWSPSGTLWTAPRRYLLMSSTATGLSWGTGVFSFIHKKRHTFLPFSVYSKVKKSCLGKYFYILTNRQFQVCLMIILTCPFCSSIIVKWGARLSLVISKWKA